METNCIINVLVPKLAVLVTQFSVLSHHLYTMVVFTDTQTIIFQFPVQACVACCHFYAADFDAFGAFHSEVKHQAV